MEPFEPYAKEISIPSLIIATILCTVVTIGLFYQLYCGKKARVKRGIAKKSFKPKTRSTNGLIMVCVVSCTLCEWLDMIRWIHCASINESLFYYPLNQIMSIADLLYYIGAVTFYIIAIFRLEICFEDTSYEINNSLLIFFGILISMAGLTAIYYSIIVALQPKENADLFFAKYDTAAVVILMILDLILNACLLILFIKKLRQLLMSTLIQNDTFKIGSSIDTLSLNMVDLITRHSLLFGIAIITNQLFSITNIFIFWGGGLSKNVHFLVFCARALENTANCIVLFLGLSKNHKWYSSICSKSHKLLAYCCIQNTQYKLNKVIEMNRKAEHYQRMEEHLHQNEMQKSHQEHDK